MPQPNYPCLVDVPTLSPPPCDPITSLERAYERVRDEIASVADSDAAQMNIDVTAAIARVQFVAPAIGALREAHAHHLQAVDLARVARLADYADALAYLHTDFVHQDRPVDLLPAMYAEALRFRETVLAVGRVLVRLRLLESSVFDRAGSVQGYRNVGYELGNLCGKLLDAYPHISGRCPLSEEQLLRGKHLAARLVVGVAVRTTTRAQRTSVTIERRRAYTLMVRAYDEARRMVAFVRWHEGDADAIAPSLYAGRRRKRSRASAVPVAIEEFAPSAPSAPSAPAAYGARLSSFDPLPDASSPTRLHHLSVPPDSDSRHARSAVARTDGSS